MHAFSGNDFVTIKGVERADLELVFDVAREMEQILRARTRSDLLRDKLLGLMFFQVSTRTRISFESAMLRLGGGVTGFVDPKTTRAGDYYAESLPDVVRMMENYADVLVVRHPQDGAPTEAASFTDVPVINAGDGYNEHPTQALLDVYTIFREKGHLEGLTVGLVGDMNMRVMHSLPLALAQFKVKVYFISPGEQSLPDPWRQACREAGLQFEELTRIDDVLGELDAIYLMGTKTPSYAEGRAESGMKRETTPQAYVIDSHVLARAKPDVILLHPLPRADELPMDVDSVASARYFVQAHYGVAVRMALLALMMGRAP